MEKPPFTHMYEKKEGSITEFAWQSKKSHTVHNGMG